MSSARKPQNNNHYARVQPTKALLFCSGSCEVQAAYIRNQAIEAIENNDVAAVSKRFNQSGRAQANALFSGIAYSIGLVMAMKCALDFNEKLDNLNYPQPSIEKSLYGMLELSFIFFALFSFLRVPTGFANAYRHRGTNTICQDWLNEHLDKKTIHDIANVPGDDIDTYLEKKFTQ